MVCRRCKMAVVDLLKENGFNALSVQLGEVEIEEALSPQALEQLDTTLRTIGFELLDDQKSKTIEKIKTLIVQLVHHTDEHLKQIFPLSLLHKYIKIIII